MQNVLDTAIPMPEDDALIGVPIRWKLCGVDMLVPLFTLPVFRTFDRLSRAIRFRIITGDDEPIELSLQRVAQLSEDSDDIDVEQTVRAAVASWQAVYPDTPCPENLADLICAVSWPQNVEKANEMLADWYSRRAIAVDPDPSDAFAYRNMLARVVEHSFPAEKVAALVRDLQDANTTVKKKLLFLPPRDEPTTKGQKAWRDLSSIFAAVKAKRRKTT